jgi:Ubiquitin family
MDLLRLKVMIGNKQIVVEIAKNETIDDLKAYIYDLEDIPGFMQELVLPDGNIIHDMKRTVEEYNLGPDVVITVNVKVREVDTTGSKTCNPNLQNSDDLVEA